MRDLFRLIALALISCAIVGAAMIYSRDGDLGASIRNVASTAGETLSVVGQKLAGAEAGASDNAAEGNSFPVTIGRAKAAQWVGLAGFPDQTELVFPIPAGATYQSGALVLSFDTQLTEVGDGLLTVSVDGTPRRQIVLEGGNASHQLRIELTAAELVLDRIVLGLAGRGTTNSGQICPVDAANSGSAVTLSADSRLELRADQPLTDAVDALLAAPSPLVLDGGQTASDSAMVAWANQQLNRGGVAARIGVAGAAETPVTLVDHAASAAGVATRNQLIGQQAIAQLIKAAGAAMPVPSAWPVTAADLGAETSVRSFRGSRRWTIGFAAADLPGGHLPEQFMVRLKATPLADDNDWVVRVTLNGNLIETRRLDGSADSIAFAVDLPEARLQPSNDLMVELVDTTGNEGVCRKASDAQAQLLPESALSDTSPPSTEWAELIEQIAAAPHISITSSAPLGDAHGAQASALLAMLLPRQAKVRFDGDAAVKLDMVDRAGFAATVAKLPVGQSVVAALPARGKAAMTVVALPSPDFAAALAQLEADDVFVIIAGP